MQSRFLIFIGLLLVLYSTETDMPGTVVVSIHDGDTISVRLTDDALVRVRLHEIDAPELAQPYGTNAKQALSDLTLGQHCSVQEEKKDVYRRLLAHVYCNGIYVNAEMVRNGNAWVYRKYSKDPLLAAAEKDARTNKRGLWGATTEEPVPPWQWRTVQKEARKKPGAQHDSIEEERSCGKRRRCNEMRTCEEARFYLEQCNVSALDRNKDGVPCEALCR